MNTFGAAIFLAAVFLFATFLNWYVFQAIKTLSLSVAEEKNRTIISIVYWIIFQGLSVWLILTFLKVFRMGEITADIQTVMNIFLTIMVTQMVCILVLFGEDVLRNLQAGFQYVSGGFQGIPFPSRNKWVSLVAIMLATVPFFSFVYGIKYGKFNYQVKEEILYFDDLPAAFDGFRVVQISDIHSGSFKDDQGIQKGIELVKLQKADLFVFTGDLVNHKADEIEPFIPNFAQIKTPYGQFSIIGNHDYGDYVSWENAAAKKQNFERLQANHAKLGWKLLNDTHVKIEKEGQHIVLMGVENWGLGFKTQGDLNKALEGVESDDFKILLSHDPSHWEAEVKNHVMPIHLTLSGHTHGMQFGIETPLFRWSPVQYRYPNWAGLSESKGRYLYVNRGFGFHAFSGRVGIWPEITVIELRRKGE
ncbi:metallophosphoesterase [Mongoliitalea daihaiensis]|uniref:metallophosphoesterase n=1 Tax=Mongoliitalea daihaiensis TaxID=2782006 RepID=UPI001F2A315A|nr:metallophosphoesterase [Mongoliitalea daihaiensis]UJP63436.1 metallophosphoesterase [Mongoliitalea daihaiensis]